MGLTGAAQALAGQLASQGKVDELLLFDPAEDRLVATQADLATAVLGMPAARVHAGDYFALQRAQVLVVDLAGEPGAVAQQVAAVAEQIQQSNFSGVVVNASQPNEATTALISDLWQLPPRQVVGLGTGEDSRQLQAAVAEALHVSPTSVTGWVYGQHRQEIVPVWSTVRVDGRPVDAPINGRQLDRSQALIDARLRAFQLQKGDGGMLTTAALLAEAVQAVLLDQGRLLPLAVYQPQYEGYLSFPTTLGAQGVTSYLLGDLLPVEEGQLKVAAAAIKDQTAALKRQL